MVLYIGIANAILWGIVMLFLLIRLMTEAKDVQDRLSTLEAEFSESVETEGQK